MHRSSSVVFPGTRRRFASRARALPVGGPRFRSPSARSEPSGAPTPERRGRWSDASHSSRWWRSPPPRFSAAAWPQPSARRFLPDTRRPEGTATTTPAPHPVKRTSRSAARRARSNRAARKRRDARPPSPTTTTPAPSATKDASTSRPLWACTDGDQDGNNGCGNDADRDDDNEGLCGGPRSESLDVSARSPTVSAQGGVVGARSAIRRAQGAPVTEVLGARVTRSSANGGPGAEVLGLAVTGFSIASFVGAGLALLTLGGTLMVGTRRRMRG